MGRTRPPQLRKTGLGFVVMQTASSVALAVITFVYATFTWRIAEATREGAVAARVAAEAAAASANASLQAARLAEAALKITFDISFQRVPEGTGVEIGPASANVWIHGATLEPTIVRYNERHAVRDVEFLDQRKLELMDPARRSLPEFVHAEDGIGFLWADYTWPDQGYELVGEVRVSYSLYDGGALLEIAT
jgi:hypothetical protein